MIDLNIVGALVRYDLTGYCLDERDARLIIRNRVVTDVRRALDRQAGGQSSGAVGIESVTNSGLTEEATALLVHANRRAVVNSLRQATAASQVAQILDEAGVPALVYKGVAAGVALTGDWRGRESTDVDVLIAPEDLDAAHDALLAAGLRRRGDDQRRPSRFNRFRAIEVGYEGLPVAIDLHWHVESPGYFAIPFPDMWSRRQRLSGDGLDVWAPSTPEALLIAAVHGTRESWRSLRHVMDFAQLASQISVDDWRQAAELSQSGPRKSLAIALAAAEQCGVTRLPAQAGPWAQDAARGYLAPLQQSLEGGSSRNGALRRSPGGAIERRLRRWATGPSIVVSADGLLRSVLRQVGHGGKRSWDATPRTLASHRGPSKART